VWLDHLDKVWRVSQTANVRCRHFGSERAVASISGQRLSPSNLYKDTKEWTTSLQHLAIELICTSAGYVTHFPGSRQMAAVIQRCEFRRMLISLDHEVPECVKMRCDRYETRRYRLLTVHLFPDFVNSSGGFPQPRGSSTHQNPARLAPFDGPSRSSEVRLLSDCVGWPILKRKVDPLPGWSDRYGNPASANRPFRLTQKNLRLTGFCL